MARSGNGLDEERLLGRAWRFERGDGALIAPQLRLLPGGRIGLHTHPNEAGWAVRDGTLVFTDADGCARTRFDDANEGADGLQLAGPFVSDPGVRHVLRETTKLERLASAAEAATPLRRGPGERPNLVVLRADRASLHTSWARDLAEADRNWDFCISWYRSDCPTGVDPDADWEAVQTEDRKFPALWKLFASGSPLWRYRFVMLADDDLLMSWRGINRAFEVARAYDMLLTQPSLSPDSFVTHELTRQQNGSAVRFTDFVESMTPIFSQAALRTCLPTFGCTRLGFGLDHLWPRLLGDPPNRIGVIDEVAVTHTRPLGTGYALAEAMAEERTLLRAFGVWQSYRERGRIAR